MIKHIVFDFGGVILNLDGVHTGYPDDLALIFNLPVAETKKLWDEHKTKVMTGRETPKQFLARMKKELKLDFDLDQGLAFWEQRNGITRDRIDWQLVSYLELLNKKYQVHMLTDQIQLANGAQEWINQINDHFHTIFRSYEQGFRKPDPEAYHNMLRLIKAPADQVVFIDDAEVNIRAADALGVNGILYTFKNHALLQSSLRALGVTW